MWKPCVGCLVEGGFKPAPPPMDLLHWSTGILQNQFNLSLLASDSDIDFHQQHKVLLSQRARGDAGNTRSHLSVCSIQHICPYVVYLNDE